MLGMESGGMLVQQNIQESIIFIFDVHIRVDTLTTHVRPTPHSFVRPGVWLLFTAARVNWRSWTQRFNCLSDLSEAQIGEREVWTAPPPPTSSSTQPSPPTQPLSPRSRVFNTHPLLFLLSSSLHPSTQPCHVVSQSKDLSLLEMVA